MPTGEFDIFGKSSRRAKDQLTRLAALGLAESGTRMEMDTQGSRSLSNTLEIAAYARDLRSPDASLAASLAAGEWSLGPLRVRRDGANWFQHLSRHKPLFHYAHSFQWLRDLSGAPGGSELAESLSVNWLEHFGTEYGPEWGPDLAAERVIHLLSSGRNVIGSADPDLAAGVMHAFGRSVKLLIVHSEDDSVSPDWRRSIALILAGACVVGQEATLAIGLEGMKAVLAREIFADGSHVSRNPEHLAGMLFDLAMSEELLLRRGLSVPEAIGKFSARIVAFLYFLRQPDGGLPPMNGGSEGDGPGLATLLARYDPPARKFGWTRLSGLQKLETADILALFDVGDIPPPPWDETAHASALAFSLSSAAGRIVTACGQPVWASTELADALASGRAHSTATVNGEDSVRRVAELKAEPAEIDHRRWAPLPSIHARRLEEDDQTWIEAQHDGWRSRFGFAHRRRLYLHRHQPILRGEDSLFRPLNDGKSPSDSLIPWQIRFHFAPGAEWTGKSGENRFNFSVNAVENWQFRCSAGELAIAESYYFAGKGHRQKILQIVINAWAEPNGSGNGASNQILWSFTRMNGDG